MAKHPDRTIQMRESYIDMVVMPMNVFMRPDSGQGPSVLDEYFERVPRDRPLLREIYAGGPDPFDLVSRLWQGVGWTEVPALEGTRPYHTDVLWGLRAPSVADPHIDAALGTFGQQHGHDRARRAVAEQLAERLLMIRDAMSLDQRDETGRCVARQGRLGKVRIGGEEILRPAVQIGEIRAPAANLGPLSCYIEPAPGE